MSEELKPCPFCGLKEAYVEQLDSDSSVVVCCGRIDENTACLARGPVGLQEGDFEVQPGYAAAVREWNSRAALAAPEQEGLGYPPCDYCGTVPDYLPWHGSGLLNGAINKHIHACDQCRCKLPAHDDQEPVVWGSPKTVRQLIRQLQTLDPDLETVALYRLPRDVPGVGGKVRQGHISTSYERMEGQWLGPYKGSGRLVLAFWTKLDPRENPDGEPVMVARLPGISRFDLESPDGPEQFLKNLFKVHIGRNDFDAYIHAHLASDFAYVLSKWIAQLSAQLTPAKQ